MYLTSHSLTLVLVLSLYIFAPLDGLGSLYVLVHVLLLPHVCDPL